MSVIVQGLTKKFGNQIAVNNISFEAKKGQILGFLGPNGAGKSTTMKMMTGYLPSQEGSIQIEGFDIKTQTLEARKCIGYLPEHNPLYTDMYIKEYLPYMGALHGVPAHELSKRTQEMITLTGLEKEQHKKIGALSKGYRQRVGLAQALFHNPPVLILDEPTTGLDPNQIQEIRRLILELGKDKCVIFSTHIMQEVEMVCDQVIILHEGQIATHQSLASLKNQVGQQILSLHFDQMVEIEHYKSIAAIAQIIDKGQGMYSFHLHDGADPRPEIFQLANTLQHRLLELKTEQLSLDQIFRSLTQNNNSNNKNTASA